MSSSSPIKASTKPRDEKTATISCDYLVVGAGTACMSFVDTVLTHREDATFIIVDRNSGPGGHWTKSYPFVRLHQPSAYYGVNSVPLAPLDKNGVEPFDHSVRASGKEVCEYYEKVVQKFEKTGRVTTYFNTIYEGEVKNSRNKKIKSNTYRDPTAKITHSIVTKNGRKIYVDAIKVVQSETDVQVPSMRERLPFPVDWSVTSVPLNDLYSNIGPESSHEKYLVVGGGKSGIDAIVYLLEQGNVQHDQITWVVPRTAWYFIRDIINPKSKPGRQFWKDSVKKVIQPIINANSAEEAFLNMEKGGVVQRVHPDDGHLPQVFKGATIDLSEIEHLRKLKHVVTNKGRITSITADQVVFADGAHTIPFSSTNTLVVDCTAANNYGYFDAEDGFKTFNPHKIRLGPLTNLFNPSQSAAQAGFFESKYTDTSSGDKTKNAYLYFPRGKDFDHSFLHLFLLSWYSHMKTDFESNQCPGYQKFVLSARTDRQQPSHHGGILGLLWAVFGPLKLVKRTVTFMEKMENGAYKDFPTDPLPGRTGASRSMHEANVRYPSQETGEFKPKKSASKKTKRKKGVALPRKLSTEDTAVSVPAEVVLH